ncbi:MAG: ATP-dependent DNA helicase RecQ [Acidobacteriaceae bacterium]|nr:ATP-dependent DNA helicase RecQ [Acidobacteriaceae bacterium]
MSDVYPHACIPKPKRRSGGGYQMVDAMPTSDRKQPAQKRTGTKGTRKTSSTIVSAARKNFGFESLRAGQEDAVRALLDGNDSLVVMPTGSGKSAIYQIAGLMLEGATVVVSPLIALQKDQVDAINAAEGPDAVVVNSAQRIADARAAIEKIEEGSGKYIFLAPEQFRKQETIEVLEKANVALFVVDEAHCISEWGHDFRPDYLDLGPVIQRLEHPVVLAMTATASPQVRDEIVQRLGLRNPKLFVHGFDRPNIYLRVDSFKTESDKLDALVHRVHWADKPGIVYVATRKNAETIMHALEKENVRAVFYHAGLKASERTEIQERFMSGDAEVIVATNAFGMGIDKADVRFVYHYDVPDSIDSYYQEIGRAGRDGEKAEAVLFFRDEDMGVQKFLTGEGKLETEQIEKVAQAIANQNGPVQPEQIAPETDLSERKLTRVIQRLQDVGGVEKLPTGEVVVNEDVDLNEVAEAAADEQQHRKDTKRARLRKMQEYAHLNSCRREFLLGYFADNFTGPCNNCDNCRAAVAENTGDIQVDPSVGTRREVS